MDGDDHSPRWNVYFQRYETGIPVEPLKEIGTCDDTGTHCIQAGSLDFTDVVEFNLEEIETRVSETAFLNAGLKITILDVRGESLIKLNISMKAVFRSMSANSMSVEKCFMQTLSLFQETRKSKKGLSR